MSSISGYSKKQFVIHPSAVIQAAILLVCVIALYWPVIPGLIRGWGINFPGFIVPLGSIYFAWRKSSDLQKTKRSPEFWGLLIMIISGMGLFLGKVSNVLFVGHISLVITLVGLILYILGWEYFKLLSFPLIFLFFMVPIPSVFLVFVIHKLQFISAYFGALGLCILNVPVVAEGNIIYLPKTTILVAEACAGMRYVFATTILAVFLVYLTQRTWLARILYMIAAILIAVLTNILRVASAGAMANFISEALISGFYHKLHGWIMFLFTYGGLIGTAVLFSKIFRKTAQKENTNCTNDS